jgi:C_GCAxxG_C_C family probable redox protein
VLLAVAEHKDIQNELIPRIATGFCSGMARTGGMCGAVSGGIMAIGLSLGRSSPDESVDPCYEAIREFLEQFTAQFNSISCLELTGVYLGTPEGQAAFREMGKITECTNFVGEAARMVVEIVD